MRIYIITMEDPLFTLPFIKDIISARTKDVIGVAIAKGGRLKIGKKRSKVVYLLSLLLIMGIPAYIKNVGKVLAFKIRRKLAGVLPNTDPGLAHFCSRLDIPLLKIGSPNNKEFLQKLASLKPDVIINQSQYILKSELLSIPKHGVLNRHNALLPKNRGRLTPFWVLYKGEKETGVSIHFVNEELDAGPIIVQERFKVDVDDTFNSIVSKNYSLASKAMLRALDLLESGQYTTLPNNATAASVNQVPAFSDALRFRIDRLFRK